MVGLDASLEEIGLSIVVLFKSQDNNGSYFIWLGLKRTS